MNRADNTQTLGYSQHDLVVSRRDTTPEAELHAHAATRWRELVTEQARERTRMEHEHAKQISALEAEIYRDLRHYDGQATSAKLSLEQESRKKQDQENAEATKTTQVKSAIHARETFPAAATDMYRKDRSYSSVPTPASNGGTQQNRISQALFTIATPLSHERVSKEPVPTAISSKQPKKESPTSASTSIDVSSNFSTPTSNPHNSWDDRNISKTLTHFPNNIPIHRQRILSQAQSSTHHCQTLAKASYPASGPRNQPHGSVVSRQSTSALTSPSHREDSNFSRNLMPAPDPARKCYRRRKRRRPHKSSSSSEYQEDSGLRSASEVLLHSESGTPKLSHGLRKNATARGGKGNLYEPLFKVTMLGYDPGTGYPVTWRSDLHLQMSNKPTHRIFEPYQGIVNQRRACRNMVLDEYWNGKAFYDIESARFEIYAHHRDRVPIKEIDVLKEEVASSQPDNGLNADDNPGVLTSRLRIQFEDKTEMADFVEFFSATFGGRIISIEESDLLASLQDFEIEGALSHPSIKTRVNRTAADWKR